MRRSRCPYATHAGWCDCLRWACRAHVSQILGISGTCVARHQCQPRSRGRIIAIVLRRTDRAANTRNGISVSDARSRRKFLFVWIACVWWWSRCVAVTAIVCCPARLGFKRCVPCRVRCGPSGSRPSLYVRGLPWNRAGAGPPWADRWTYLSRGNLYSVISACRRCPAILGCIAEGQGDADGASRYQRRCCRASARSPIQSGMDERDSVVIGFRAGD